MPGGRIAAVADVVLGGPRRMLPASQACRNVGGGARQADGQVRAAGYVGA